MKLSKAERVRTVFAVVFNVAIFAVTAFCVLTFFVKGGRGNMEVVGPVAFRYFTVDSNVLVAVASLFVAVFGIVKLATGREYPEWVRVFKFVGTVAVMLTFLTVVVFLGFIYGFKAMFVGINLFLHLLTPLAALLTLWIAEAGVRIRPAFFALGVAPMIVYGAVYLWMVIFAEKWEDFYHLANGGKWWVSVLAMVAGTALIAVVTGVVANAISGGKSTGKKAVE
jgi:hypothetical protein